jgi:NAD(P)-dependent dehydrogenase (short-subunit alcohol dehydrogenase family)
MSLYAAAHLDFRGPGDARPTALQIIKDEHLEGNLKGKVIVITGTSSGIGVETARALFATGATLFLTARDTNKATAALTGILDAPHVTLVAMDNTSFDSVRTAAATILAKSNYQVNILINNAGVMAVPDLQLTKDGHELQFGTNHLAHFLLFQLLKQALLASSTPQFHSRVVNVSSSGHRASGINETDNYNFQKGGYNPWAAYGQSKTANIYMANEIDRRYGSQGLHATSLHPGGINTDLKRYMDGKMVEQYMQNPALTRKLKSPQQGAATTVLAAVGKEWENKGGRYLVDCAEAKKGEDDGDVEALGCVSHTYDPEKEARLWEDSLKITGFAD